MSELQVGDRVRHVRSGRYGDVDVVNDQHVWVLFDDALGDGPESVYPNQLELQP